MSSDVSELLRLCCEELLDEAREASRDIMRRIESLRERFPMDAQSPSPGPAGRSAPAIRWAGTSR